MRKLILYIIGIFFVYACGKHTPNQRLVTIDSLISKDLCDSALFLVQHTDTSAFSTYDIAYFQLLKNAVLFKLYQPIANDSVINKAIDIFKENHDQEKLSEAYYYKGAINVVLGFNSKAVEAFKMAETLCKSHPSPILLTKVLTSLSFLNRKTGNYQLALQYGKKALTKAQSLQDKRWIGYCIDNIGVIFDFMGEMDSCNYYFRMARPFIKYQPINDQVQMLDNQAAFYWNIGNEDSAEIYLKKSLTIRPLQRTYGLLASVYTEKKRYKEADSLWKQVLHTKDIQTKVNTLYPYSEWLYKQGRLKEAWETAMKVPALKDSLAQQQQAEAIMGRQTAYDRQVARMLYQQRIERLTYSVAFMLLFVIIVWMIFYIKSQRTKKQMAENQLLLSNYIQAHEELRKKGKEQSKEVNELNKKIEALRKQQTSILAKGKVRYEEIVNGGNTATWHKADFNDFMEYYRTVNFPFVIHLEQDFKSLPPSNKTILSLYEMGYDDTAVAYIMSMTEGALRTAKSRINKRSRVRA